MNRFAQGAMAVALACVAGHAGAELISTIPAEEVESTPPVREVELHGLFKLQATDTGLFEGGRSRRLLLDTANLGIGIPMGERLSGQVTLHYEDGRGDPDRYELDEAYFGYADPERSPWFGRVGRMYVPVGIFQSFMVANPLTLELAETRVTAVRGGYDQPGWNGSLFLFDAQGRVAGEAQRPEFGLDLGYRAGTEERRIDVGVAYLSSLAESKNMRRAVAAPTAMHKRVGAVSAHAVAVTEPVTLMAEYVGAVDRFHAADLAFRDRGAQPAAWMVEAGYGFDLLGYKTVFALGYQGSEEALALGIPRRKQMAALSTVLSPNLTVTLEYAVRQDYGAGDTSGEASGTGRERQGVTLQLAVQF